MVDLITKKKFSRREFVKLTSAGLVVVSGSLWLPRSAWAATVQRYVNTNSSGGDGTTNGTSGSISAYPSLSAWEAAEQTDLVADGDSHVVTCDNAGGDDSTAFTIDGWTTGASNPITIEANSNSYHDGTTGSGYVIANEVTVVEPHVNFHDLSFVGPTGYDTKSIQLNGVENIFVRRCNFHSGSTTALTSGINAYGGDAGGNDIGITIENSFFVGYAKGAVVAQPEGFGPAIDYKVHCCSVQNIDGHGDYSGASAAFSMSAIGADTRAFYIYNTLVGDAIATVGVRFGASTSDFTGDYNVGEDALLPGANTLDNYSITDSASPGAGDWMIVTETAVGSEDLHLQNDADNDILQAGDSTGMPTDDIDRNTRTGTYDIGAHQVSAAATGGGSKHLGALGVGT